MQHTNQDLPPLNYLLAFEAAAKFQSFVAASRDLNISETSISRKVRLLELHYQIPLFVRNHRSIQLTTQGRLFLDKIQPALDILRTTSKEILDNERSRTVVLAATNSVASLWLLPRLRKFNQSNKHLKIMLVSSDSDMECLADNVDLSILRGSGKWAGYDAQLLFGETIFPVCSPGYLKSNPSVAYLDELNSQDLIEVTSDHTEWMNWNTWLGRVSKETSQKESATMFNTYPLAIQAAVEGLGVALGWANLVNHHLEAGELVRPAGQINLRTDDGYFLLKQKNATTTSEIQAVENWLLRTSASRTRHAKK